LALVQVLDDEDARQPVLVTPELPRAGRSHRDAVRGHRAAADFRARLRVDDRDRAGEDAARAEHASPTHPRALGDDAPAADEAVVLDDDGRGLRRLEHAADSDAA